MARVLIVDDQKIPRVAVSGLLRSVGHEVLTADNGEEGIAVAREAKPDVIILDVHMPGMDGFEVVEQLKKDASTAPTPVIFLTAERPTDDLIVRGLELGAYDFLSKGGSKTELLARVGVMARIKRGNDELSAIARISDTLIQSLDPDEVSTLFVEQVAEIFRADGVILAFTPKTGEERVLRALGFDHGDDGLPALTDALIGEMASIDSAVIDLDPGRLDPAAADVVRRMGLQSAVVTRVEHEDRPPSLVAIFAREIDRFARDSDSSLLHLLGRQANIALDNAYLHEQSRAQREALEEAMEQRSRFFATMSHELRTPINAVIGYNQLLEMGTYGELNQAQMEAVSKIDRSARHQLELVNDILDISKIEAGKLVISREPTDLCTIVRDTLTTVHIQAEEKSLELRSELPGGAPVTTDPARVRQILLNLLSNAVKFTERGSVLVRVASDDGEYRVSVTDTGPGIAPEDQDRVFEEFEQTGGSASGGTGLGLAISRRLAQLLGGHLSLESGLGTGSTFTLALPREPGAKTGG